MSKSTATPIIQSQIPLAIKHFFAAGMAALFLALEFVLKDMLPDKLFQDSGKLQDIIENNNFDGSSFGVTAWLLALVPDALWPVVLTALAVGLIAVLVYPARRWLDLALLALVLPPVFVINALVPSKETIVMTMSLALVVYGAIQPGPRSIVAILAAYLLYGAFVRSYYLMILGLFIGLQMSRVVKRWMLAAGFAVAFVGIWLVPSEVFHALQDQRDESNNFATFVAGSDNRTAFYNPFPPDSADAFVMNYAYAAAILNLPIFMDVTEKELLLLVCNIAVGLWIYRGLRSKDDMAINFTLLFIAHILTLWLFEPDLGSYFRHYSSAIAYIGPAIGVSIKSNRKKSA